MTPHVWHARLSAAVFFLGTAWAGAAPANKIPEPAGFLAAFKAQFPKSPASGAALALEELAARMGLALAPREMEVSADGLLGDRPRKNSNRPEPSAEAILAQRERGSLAGSFLSAQLGSSREKVGAPPSDLQRYLEEHATELASIRAVLLNEPDVSWEVDVSHGSQGPFPSLVAVIRLERLLLAEALIEARAGQGDEALQTVDASWRLNESLSSRPELISQLVALGGARLHAGVLRKIDVPAFGWQDRLRGGSVLAGMVAAFENEAWQTASPPPDLTGEAGAWGRMLRRIGEEFRERSRCGLTQGALQEVVLQAARAEARQEEDSLYLIAMPNLLNALLRAARFEVDAEVTSLVIDARIERNALRRRHWPGKLTTLGHGTCSEQEWSYRVLRDGTVRIAFEGVPPEDSAPNHLSLEVFAGTQVRGPHGKSPRRRMLRSRVLP